MQIYKKKSRNHSVQLFKLLIVLLSFSFGMSGCYKRKDTVLRVFVLDSDGSMVEGANVNVFAEPTDTTNQNPVLLNYSMVTDANGTVFFDLNKHYESGQSGLAIVKVKATYMNMSGEAIVQLVEETDNECNIQIE